MLKHIIGLNTVVPFLIVSFALAAASPAYASDARGCSRSLVAGTFGFTTTGSIPAVGPVAATGVFTQDREGNIKGTQTRSLNGSVADETFTGTATVNSDCTGTDTVQVFQDGSLVRTTTLHVVYDDNGREARAIFTSLVLQPSGVSLPSIITIEARKLSSREAD